MHRKCKVRSSHKGGGADAICETHGHCQLTVLSPFFPAARRGCTEGVTFAPGLSLLHEPLKSAKQGQCKMGKVGISKALGGAPLCLSLSLWISGIAMCQSFFANWGRI